MYFLKAALNFALSFFRIVTLENFDASIKSGFQKQEVHIWFMKMVLIPCLSRLLHKVWVVNCIPLKYTGVTWRLVFKALHLEGKGRMMEIFSGCHHIPSSCM